MADDGNKTPTRNSALLTGEFGSALPSMVSLDQSLDPEEDSVSLPEISRSFDGLAPSAAELPDDDDSFEEESFWEEVSSDGEADEDEDSRETLDEVHDGPLPDSAEYEAADTAELEAPPEFIHAPEPDDEVPETDDEPAAAPIAAAPPEPTFEPMPEAFDPLEESTPWVKPGNNRKLFVMAAVVVVLALGIGGWFLWLGTQGGDGAERTPGSLAHHATTTQGGMGAAVLPMLPTPHEANAATLDQAPATVEAEPVAEKEALAEDEVAAPEEAAAEPDADDALASAEPIEEVLPAAPILAPTVGDPWAAPSGAADAPPAVELHHAPLEQLVVGDKVLIRTTTPGLVDCEVHLYWHRPGESLQQHALYRSGASHSLVMTVAPEMGPTFEYFLVATGCGAAVWPADGATQTVAVR